MRKRSSNCLIYFIMSLMPGACWCGMRAYEAVEFKINCESYLKRAADSGTVDTASKEIGQAIKYLENNHMTEGNTSVFWESPSNDVGFWYRNLKSTHGELDKVSPETTQLERTNVLMKLRETLLDHSSEGDKVTLPYGISVFPNHIFYFLTGFLSIAIFIAVGFCCFKDDDFV